MRTVKPNKAQLERRNLPFKFSCRKMKSWFYLGEDRLKCSFHQENTNGQQNVYGLKVKRLVAALKACGYIALVLCLPIIAEAGGVPTDCGSNGRQDCVMYGDQDLGLVIKPVEKCELKMKEAMKLIAPYIDYGDTVSTTDALYRSPQQKLREEADRMDKRDAAIRRWNMIYQECVK